MRIFQKYGDVEISRTVNPSPDSASFERHCHSKYELLYLISGKGSYTVEGVEYPLLPNSLFLLRPYEYHYVRPMQDSVYDRIVIYFETDSIPATLRMHPLLTEARGNHFPICADASPLRASFDALVGGIVALSQEGGGSTPESEALLRASIAQILLLLTHETPSAPVSGDGGLVRRVIDYLNLHLESELSLDALAREFYVSKYHLCRLFREQTGVTLFTYFNTKRMTLARRLIHEGKGATAVAQRLGFHDYSTFYRTYRKYTGESPKRSGKEA